MMVIMPGSAPQASIRLRCTNSKLAVNRPAPDALIGAESFVSPRPRADIVCAGGLRASLNLLCSQPAIQHSEHHDRSPQRGFQIAAPTETSLFCLKNGAERPLFHFDDIDLVRRPIDTRRIANNVDQPIHRMEASEQVIVLPEGLAAPPGVAKL